MRERWLTTEQATLHYVGFGGHRAMITGDKVRLGTGVDRHRNWIWHFCFGYVSGFPVHAIFYYLVTRHSLPIVMHWAWKRERAEFEAGGQRWPQCRVECKRCAKEAS